MQGWRFFQKPVGLELYFLKPELTFTFFLFIFFLAKQDGSYWSSFYRAGLSSIGNQTPPSTAENNDCSDSGNYYFSRSAVAVLRQSNSHRRTGTKRSPAFTAGRSGEKYCERETAGKKYKSALAFLIQGQSANGANPDGCAKEQPLKK
jgi:hypothetical protein